MKILKTVKTNFISIYLFILALIVLLFPQFGENILYVGSKSLWLVLSLIVLGVIIDFALNRQKYNQRFHLFNIIIFIILILILVYQFKDII